MMHTYSHHKWRSTKSNIQQLGRERTTTWEHEKATAKHLSTFSGRGVVQHSESVQISISSNKNRIWAPRTWVEPVLLSVQRPGYVQCKLFSGSNMQNCCQVIKLHRTKWNGKYMTAKWTMDKIQTLWDVGLRDLICDAPERNVETHMFFLPHLMSWISKSAEELSKQSLVLPSPTSGHLCFCTFSILTFKSDVV